VSENRVLRRIFEPQREGVTGGSRGLHDEELHDLKASAIVNAIVKSRKLR
jgi:hypothetical protein